MFRSDRSPHRAMLINEGLLVTLETQKSFIHCAVNHIHFWRPSSLTDARAKALATAFIKAEYGVDNPSFYMKDRDEPSKFFAVFETNWR